MESEWKRGRNIRVFVIGLLLGVISFFISYFHYLPAQWLVAVILLLMAFNLRLFFIVVLPVLSCFTSFEGNLSQIPDLIYFSPHSTLGIGSLWSLSIVLLVIGNVSWYKIKIKQLDLFLVSSIFILLMVSTVYFSLNYGVNVILNKEPIKLLVFIALTVFFIPSIVNTCYKYPLLVVSSVYVLFSAVVSHRILSLTLLELKDVGGYNYLTIPLCVWLGWKSWQTKDTPLFWISLTVLILSFKISRTEILLFAIFFPLFFILSRRYLSMFVILLGASWGLGIMISSSSSYSQYFQHKLSFFLNFSMGEAAEIGNSALVRLYEFLNILFGFGADLYTVLFGRGLFGYINFDKFYNSAIYSENTFSEIEHATNTYFRLHFFLNELIFYFGLFGMCILIYLFIRLLGRIKLMTFPFVVYLILNGMFRIELLFLISFFYKYMSENRRQSY